MMYGLLLISIAYIFEVSPRYPKSMTGQTDEERGSLCSGVELQAYLPLQRTRFRIVLRPSVSPQRQVQGPVEAG